MLWCTTQTFLNPNILDSVEFCDRIGVWRSVWDVMHWWAAKSTTELLKQNSHWSGRIFDQFLWMIWRSLQRTMISIFLFFSQLNLMCTILDGCFIDLPQQIHSLQQDGRQAVTQQSTCVDLVGVLHRLAACRTWSCWKRLFDPDTPPDYPNSPLPPIYFLQFTHK